MKVKDLIKQLSTLDAEMEIIAYLEDEELLEPGQLIRLVEPIEVSAGEAIRSRDVNGKPRVEMTAAGEGRQFAFLKLTTDH